ncbi:MAG: VWA domain-containing protein [Planctomycetes bacterium]|nr:VWA domain-containing protein [Planctomycetota bacterium]
MNMLAADMVERRLELVRLPAGWLAVAGIVLLVTLLASIVLLYSREQRSGASVRVRRLLAGARCLTILLLAVVWLEPVLATYLHRRNEAYTLVLVDSSASMGLADRYPDPTEAARVQRAVDGAPSGTDARIDRWSVVGGLLGREEGRLLRELAERNSVRVVRFGDSAVPVGQLDAATEERGAPATQPRDAEQDAGTGEVEAIVKQLAAARPDMPATDLGRAVRQAVESVRGNPVAAIVVLSDGRFNRGEPIDVVTQYARDKRIPIYTMGIGDPSPPRNVAVAAVEAPPNVFVQDPFKVTAHLRTEGMEGESLTVELLERHPGEESPRVIQTRSVQVAAGGQVPPLTFSHKIGEAMEDRLAIRVRPHETETVADDNIRETTVRALANKMRVLLVAGGASWEYRYVSRLLERDATADVSCWLQSADAEAVREGNTVIDHFPRDPAELAVYDCLVLMDPQAGDITTSWAAEVDKMVSERGCGLLYVAGRQNTPRTAHDPDSKALLEQ